MQELVTAPGGLLSRGLLEEHATSYQALPRTKRERATLAGILNDYVSDRFPAYSQSHSGASGAFAVFDNWPNGFHNFVDRHFSQASQRKRGLRYSMVYFTGAARIDDNGIVLITTVTAWDRTTQVILKSRKE